MASTYALRALRGFSHPGRQLLPLAQEHARRARPTYLGSLAHAVGCTLSLNLRDTPRYARDICPRCGRDIPRHASCTVSRVSQSKPSSADLGEYLGDISRLALEAAVGAAAAHLQSILPRLAFAEHRPRRHLRTSRSKSDRTSIGTSSNRVALRSRSSSNQAVIKHAITSIDDVHVRATSSLHAATAAIAWHIRPSGVSGPAHPFSRRSDRNRLAAISEQSSDQFVISAYLSRNQHIIIS